MKTALVTIAAYTFLIFLFIVMYMGMKLFGNSSKYEHFQYGGQMMMPGGMPMGGRIPGGMPGMPGMMPMGGGMPGMMPMGGAPGMGGMGMMMPPTMMTPRPKKSSSKKRYRKRRSR